MILIQHFHFWIVKKMCIKINHNQYLKLSGGQDKPAWTACPPGVKISRVGARFPGTAYPPGVSQPRSAYPRGVSCPRGKINWDTGFVSDLVGTQIVGFLTHRLKNLPLEKILLTTVMLAISEKLQHCLKEYVLIFRV